MHPVLPIQTLNGIHFNQWTAASATLQTCLKVAGLRRERYPWKWSGESGFRYGIYVKPSLTARLRIILMFAYDRKWRMSFRKCPNIAACLVDIFGMPVPGVTLFGQVAVNRGDLLRTCHAATTNKGWDATREIACRIQMFSSAPGISRPGSGHSRGFSQCHRALAKNPN